MKTRKKTRPEDPRSVAELEAIKVQAIAYMRDRLQNIVGEDPDDLQGNGDDTGNIDLPMLGQYADDLSEAYQDWQDANSALWTKPEWVEARQRRHEAERAEEAEPDPKLAKLFPYATA